VVLMGELMGGLVGDPCSPASSLSWVGPMLLGELLGVPYSWAPSTPHTPSMLLLPS